MRKTIQEAAPEAQEVISYQMPTFRLNGNVVHFAAYKNPIGFYPAPSGIEAIKKELLPYKGAKGSVQFPIDKPVPYDLVRKIVQFRVQENQRKRDREFCSGVTITIEVDLLIGRRTGKQIDILILK